MFLGAFCHAIYAILRNGLWEDPVEATNGTIYTRFQRLVEKHGIHEDAASYLTWRFCYLLCYMFFAVNWAAASWASWSPDRKTYDQILAQLPSEVRASRFENFILVLSWWEPFLKYIWVTSFLLSFAGLLLASPPLAVRHAQLSRRLVWSAWMWNFLLPFLTLMVFPFRETIDWPGVREDMCVMVVSRSLRSPGIDVASALTGLQQQNLQGLANLQSAQFGQDPTINDKPVRLWCQEQGSNWHHVFCDDVMHCVVTADQRCRTAVCSELPATAQRACQTQCLEYAQASTSEAATRFTSTLESECADFRGGSPSGFSSQLNTTVDLGDLGACEDLAAQQMQMFNLMAEQQGLNTQDQCSYASLIMTNIDFVAGIFVGIEAGLLLVPSALSILGGLAESLYNVKALFPGHQEVPWVLILTSLEAVPIYTALLATLQQLMGNFLLAVACFSFIFYISLPAITARLTLHLRPGTVGRWKFYRKVWVEYGLRVPCIVAIIVCMNMFMRDTLGDEFMRDRNPLPVIAFTALEYFMRKTLTAVAGTDAMSSMFLQADSWRATFTQEELAINQDRRTSLSPLLLASAKTSYACGDGKNAESSGAEEDTPAVPQDPGAALTVVSPHEVGEPGEAREAQAEPESAPKSEPANEPAKAPGT